MSSFVSLMYSDNDLETAFNNSTYASVCLMFAEIKASKTSD